MKRFIHLFLLLTMLALSIVIFVACKKLGAQGNESSLVTNESTTPTPTEITDEATPEPTASVEPTEAAKTTTEEPSKSSSKDSNSVVFTDYLDTQEFIVKESGTYQFSCEPSDGKTTWDIYVLDEKFEDALRYLTSAYSPVVTASKNASTYDLKARQYVYCVCSQNSLTFEGNKETFKCPLTIKKAN